MNDEPNDHADLLGLLRGELDNAGVVRTRAHLDTCPQCREDLTEAAVGHALILRAATSLSPNAPVGRPRPAAAERDLPPLPPLPGRGRRLVPLLLVAATVVVAALVIGLLRPWSSDEPSPPVTADQSTTLEPVEGDGGGSVSMTGAGSVTRMVIETHDLPAVGPSQYYYAWLLDPDTNKMLPLGRVGAGGDAGTVSFELPDALLDAYSAVDVSLEDDDGDPQHSPTSVLRASYA